VDFVTGKAKFRKHNWFMTRNFNAVWHKIHQKMGIERWYEHALEQINLWWVIRKRANCFSGKEESRCKAFFLARFDDED